MKFYARLIATLLIAVVVLLGYFVVNHAKRKRMHSISKRLRMYNDTFGKVISFIDDKWHVYESFCDVDESFVRAQLKWPQEPFIFVYNTSIDKWVSGRIIKEGLWEEDNIQRIHDILRGDPSLIFIDIGANVGAFSLSMAALGNKVISIDALYENVARLCASMETNMFENRMIIIHNALSFKREKVSLGRFHLNVGATFIKRMGASETENEALVVDAILLDDLMDIFEFRSHVVIKMDVESFEAFVLKGAENFFKNVKVDYILMEFMAHRGKESGDFIVEFLEQHDLYSEFNNTNHSEWPIDVMFKRIPKSS